MQHGKVVAADGLPISSRLEVGEKEAHSLVVVRVHGDDTEEGGLRLDDPSQSPEA